MFAYRPVDMCLRTSQSPYLLFVSGAQQLDRLEVHDALSLLAILARPALAEAPPDAAEAGQQDQQKDDWKSKTTVFTL